MLRRPGVGRSSPGHPSRAAFDLHRSGREFVGGAFVSGQGRQCHLSAVDSPLPPTHTPLYPTPSPTRYPLPPSHLDPSWAPLAPPTHRRPIPLQRGHCHCSFSLWSILVSAIKAYLSFLFFTLGTLTLSILL